MTFNFIYQLTCFMYFLIFIWVFMWCANANALFLPLKRQQRPIDHSLSTMVAPHQSPLAHDRFWCPKRFPRFFPNTLTTMSRHCFKSRVWKSTFKRNFHKGTSARGNIELEILNWQKRRSTIKKWMNEWMKAEMPFKVDFYNDEVIKSVLVRLDYSLFTEHI